MQCQFLHVLMAEKNRENQGTHLEILAESAENAGKMHKNWHD